MGIDKLDFVGQYICLDVVDSTNIYAKSIGIKSDDSGGYVGNSGCDNDDKLTVIRASRQSDGRGKCGKSFYTDYSGGLWVSVIAPVADISEHFRQNRAISLAILESLKNMDKSAPISIKWPNDIYWGDRKISGVLLENIPSNPDVLILGFGVNVNIAIDNFPEDLRACATSVSAELGREQSVEQLLEDILKSYWRHISCSDNIAHKLYSNNLYKKGCAAAVDELAGTFVTVDADGRLRLETDRGHVLFSSGTLSFR